MKGSIDRPVKQPLNSPQVATHSFNARLQRFQVVVTPNPLHKNSSPLFTSWSVLLLSGSGYLYTRRWSSPIINIPLFNPNIFKWVTLHHIYMQDWYVWPLPWCNCIPEKTWRPHELRRGLIALGQNVAIGRRKQKCNHWRYGEILSY